MELLMWELWGGGGREMTFNWKFSSWNFLALDYYFLEWQRRQLLVNRKTLRRTQLRIESHEKIANCSQEIN